MLLFILYMNFTNHYHWYSCKQFYVLSETYYIMTCVLSIFVCYCDFKLAMSVVLIRDLMWQNTSLSLTFLQTILCVEWNIHTMTVFIQYLCECCTYQGLDYVFHILVLTWFVLDNEKHYKWTNDYSGLMSLFDRYKYVANYVNNILN